MVRVVHALAAAGIVVWLDGGWGVDALLGEQVREHDDLDLVADLVDSEQLVATLRRAGYDHVAGHPPKSFVLVDPSGRQVDVRPVTFDEQRGGGVYMMEDGREWVYPSHGFTGQGRVESYAVRCLSPEVQVLVHQGYDLTEKDYRELDLLHTRFDVKTPDRAS